MIPRITSKKSSVAQQYNDDQIISNPDEKNSNYLLINPRPFMNKRYIE